jgi:T5SS/PEP-CTERM-associated repeat protein/autotransporter-associated beta strand protein
MESHMRTSPRTGREISRSSVLSRKRKAIAGRGTESLSHGRQASLQWLRRKRLNQLGILYAVWLIWWMIVLPLPAWAATTFIPSGGSDGPITGPITILGGDVNVVGTDSTFTESFTNSLSGAITMIDPNTSILVKAGSGTFTIDGGTITGGQFLVIGGVVAQTSGTTNANSFLAVGTGAIPPNSGALDISGGMITFGTALHVGDFGGVGTVNQTGGAVMLGGSGAPVSLNIGNQGGSGTYNLSGGTLSFNGTNTTSFVILGRNAASTNPSAQLPSTGVLNLSGNGSMTLTNAILIIGSDGIGSNPGALPGSGIINQTGGTLSIDSGSALFLSATGNGTYNLDGGTLRIGGTSLVGNFNDTGGTYTFNLGGGTIQVIGSPLIGIVNPTLAAGTTSTIDTNGIGATWSGVLSGGGALAKAGAGTLTLSGLNTYSGGTTISQGTIAVNADTGLGAPTGPLTFNGGTLQFDSSFGLSPSRAITLNAANNGFAGGGTFDTNGNTGNTSTISQGIQGAGGLTKMGAGTLTLSGPNTYTGATTVALGTLAASAVDTLPRMTAVTVEAPGTLDLAGFNQSIGSLAGAGAVTLGNATLTAGNDNTNTTFSGAMSGTGAVDKVGAGTLTLSGNASLGGTTIDGGSLAVSGGTLNINAGVASAQNLIVGQSGVGTLAVQNGGTVTDFGGFIGQLPGSQGTATVSGAGSTWTNTGTIQVGGLGTGTLTIENGGTVNSGGGGSIGLSAGSIGAVTVTGAGSTWNNSPGGGLNIGSFGTGTLTIANSGTVINNTALAANIGNGAGSQGAVMVTGAGSTWTNSSGVNIGRLGTGTLTIADSGIVNGPIIIATNAGAVGTLNIGAGVGNAAVAPGTLTAPSVAFGAGTGTINFNHTSADYVFAPAISGNGTVNVLAGTTILTADNSYTGGTTISGGTLAVGDFANPSAALSGGGVIAVEAGARLGGYGSVTGDVINSGVISPGNAIPGFSGSPMGAFTISGNYTGAGGTMAVNTVLGGSGSPSDRLVISGGTANGSTIVHVTNVGGMGAETTGNGIPVVNAVGGATTAPGAFALPAGELRAGAFDYDLSRRRRRSQPK